jgi:hypothetical protein
MLGITNNLLPRRMPSIVGIGERAGFDFLVHVTCCAMPAATSWQGWRRHPSATGLPGAPLIQTPPVIPLQELLARLTSDHLSPAPVPARQRPVGGRGLEKNFAPPGVVCYASAQGFA